MDCITKFEKDEPRVWPEGEYRKEMLAALQMILKKKFPDSPLDPYESVMSEAGKDTLIEWTAFSMGARGLRDVFGY